MNSDTRTELFGLLKDTTLVANKVYALGLKSGLGFDQIAEHLTEAERLMRAALGLGCGEATDGW